MAQLLNRLPAGVHWLRQFTRADLPLLASLHPAFILIDPFAIQAENDTELGRLLREESGLAPMISLLPVDSREFRAASLRLGANAALPLENIHADLLPTLRDLLTGNQLAKGIQAQICRNAWNNAPYGEAVQLGEPADPGEWGPSAGVPLQTPFSQTPDIPAGTFHDELAALSRASVERLAPVLPNAAPALPSPTCENEWEDGVFLKGLVLEPSVGLGPAVLQTVRTACSLNCGNHFCGLQVHLRDQHAVKISPAAFPDPRYQRLCLKGIGHLQTVAHPGRLLYPLKRRGPRGSGEWSRITWDQALDEIYARSQEIRLTHGPRAFMFFPYSGQLSAINGMSGAYLRLASLWGASGTSMLEFGVDSAVPSGIQDVFGAGAGYQANDYTDLVNTRTLLIWGANPVYSRMNWWQFFIEAQEAGCRMITIDPKFSATAAKSDEWLPIRPGTDLYLALGLIHQLVDRELYDREFLLNYSAAPLLVDIEKGTYLRLPAPGQPGSQLVPAVLDESSGKAVPVGTARQPALNGALQRSGKTYRTSFDLLAEMAAPYQAEFVARKTGLEAGQIRTLAETLAQARPARIYTLYGIDRWNHGATFGRLIASLAALTGNLGIPGAGAGVDGFSDGIMNVSRFMSPDGRQYSWVNPAEISGYILAGQPYPIKGVFTGFNNWINQWPDHNRLENEILPALDLLVCSDLFMTETARYADYVLPAAHLFEREDLVHGPKPYVQYQPVFLPLPGECRSDFEIAAGLARRSGFGEYFDQPASAYLQQILDEDPTTAGMTIAQLAEQGALPRNLEGKSPVAFASREFNTPTGRIEFYVERLAPYGHALPVYESPVEADLDSPLANRFPLVCITEHSRYRVHSTFGNVPWLRELEQEPCAMLNPATAASKKLRDGERGMIYNDRGSVVMKVRCNHAVPPQAVYVTQGWQSSDFSSGHIQALTHMISNPLNAMGANTSFSDVLVDICPVPANKQEQASV